jgi:hypothetical protein
LLLLCSKQLLLLSSFAALGKFLSSPLQEAEIVLTFSSLSHLFNHISPFVIGKMAVPDGIPGAGVGRTNTPLRDGNISQALSSTQDVITPLAGQSTLHGQTLPVDSIRDSAVATLDVAPVQPSAALQPWQYQPQMLRVAQGDHMRATRKTNSSGVQVEDTKICVVMVGLPARGKSFIAQKGKPYP